LVASSRFGEPRASKRICTAVASLLTFWPPGPEARTKRSSISLSSITIWSLTAIMAVVDTTEAAQLGASFEPRRHSNITAVFDPDSVSNLGAEHHQTWQWTLLQRFHELPEVYVLEFAGYEMLVVPRRVFSSGEQAGAWAQGIRSRLDS
jgi:hypothetical protein